MVSATDFVAPVVAPGLTNVSSLIALPIFRARRMTSGWLPIPVLFMIASSIALAVNFPAVKDQGEAIARHSSSIVSVVAMVLAAAVLTGVFQGTGMVEAMAEWLLQVIPDAMGPHLAVITGVLSIPLTFFMTNDAFYFGVLPVLSETAAQYGIEPVEMARTVAALADPKLMAYVTGIVLQANGGLRLE